MSGEVVLQAENLVKYYPIKAGVLRRTVGQVKALDGVSFELYARPGHPYTKGLLDSIPRLDQKGETLDAIGGLPPNLMNIPPGCPFNPRCHYAKDICRVDPPPPLREVDRDRFAACHFSELVLAHSPELEVTQTTEDVEAHLELGLEYPAAAVKLDDRQGVAPAPGVAGGGEPQ